MTTAMEKTQTQSNEDTVMDGFIFVALVLVYVVVSCGQQ